MILDELAKLDWDISIALANGGPIVEEYRRRDAQLKVLGLSGRMGRLGLGSVLRVLGKPVWAAKADARRLRRLQLRVSDVDVVLVNSVPSLRAIAPGGPPVVVVVHELDFAWQRLLDDAEQHRLLAEPAAYVTSSDAVTNYLVSRGVDPGKVMTVRLPATVVWADSEPSVPSTRRGRVLAAGTLEWRKGADLFLQAAVQCERQHPGEVEWVWVGDSIVEDEGDQFRRDIAQAKLERVVCHVSAVTQLQSWYDSADVFALTSREDPYPMVMLEAAARKLPIVCFANSGGAPEFVGRGAGAVVPPLDVAAFAEAVWLRTKDRELATAEGERGADLVFTEHRGDDAAAAINDLLVRIIRETARAVG